MSSEVQPVERSNKLNSLQWCSTHATVFYVLKDLSLTFFLPLIINQNSKSLPVGTSVSFSHTLSFSHTHTRFHIEDVSC